LVNIKIKNFTCFGQFLCP